VAYLLRAALLPRLQQLSSAAPKSLLLSLVTVGKRGTAVFPPHEFKTVVKRGVCSSEMAAAPKLLRVVTIEEGRARVD
jgi:hypothetical protein